MLLLAEHFELEVERTPCQQLRDAHAHRFHVADASDRCWSTFRGGDTEDRRSVDLGPIEKTKRKVRWRRWASVP